MLMPPSASTYHYPKFLISRVRSWVAMPLHPQLSVASFRHDLWSSLHITILLVFSPIRYQVEEDL
uniref:Uncharacterized protein n=1 Tax=Aegilops tauschii subsp. strangulata TaxID=200361 RepID=A0A452ZDK7_AEGTS